MSFNADEKSFYLEAFHGTTLAISVASDSDLDMDALSGFIETVAQLSKHGCRVVLFVQKCLALNTIYNYISQAYQGADPTPYHERGQPLTLPQPLWQEGARVVPVEIATEDLELYCAEVARLVLGWRIKRLILTRTAGGAVNADGAILSYVNYKKLTRPLKVLPGEKISTVERIQKLLENGVRAVSICRLQDIARELFTYEGCGTFFSQEHYCQVRPLEVDDFPQVASLIRQGEAEGFLLPRSDHEISKILLSGYGAFVCSNHVAGVCCLINESYEEEKSGEIVTLYALTRFQGEGIGVQLINHVLDQARKMGLKRLFSCTTRQRVVDFFVRNGFTKVAQSGIPEAKWRGYDEQRRKSLVCLSLKVE